MMFLSLSRPYRTTRCCSWWRRRIFRTFLVLCRPYHTLLFLVEEKDIPEIPCVVQALPHAALPGGGEGYP